MNRMFGLMPRNEVEKERSFKDPNGLTITIQAGPNGWTIIYADYSSRYADVESTTEENFDTAFKTVEHELGILTEIKYEAYGEVIPDEDIIVTGEIKE